MFRRWPKNRRSLTVNAEYIAKWLEIQTVLGTCGVRRGVGNPLGLALWLLTGKTGFLG